MFGLGKARCADVSGPWFRGDSVPLKEFKSPVPHNYAIYFARDADFARGFGAFLHTVHFKKACIFDADREDFKPFLAKADRMVQADPSEPAWGEFASTLRYVWEEEMAADGDPALAMKLAIDKASDATHFGMAKNLLGTLGYDGYLFSRDGTTELVLMNHKVVVVDSVEAV